MAKIKFGMMMTDARGKLGGQVFSKNRSGAYVRTKVTPVNPQTSFQQANRSLLGNLSSAWSNLNQEQRLAWNSQVENWQKTNVFGDLNKPTGKNLFTGLNKVAQNYYPDNVLMLVPPAKVEFLPFSIVSAGFPTTTASGIITLSGSELASQDFRVRATPVLSAGTTYIKNQLRDLTGVLTVNGTNQLVFGTAYLARFGDANSTGTIGVEVTPVAENGQLGVPATYLINLVA